MFNLISKILAGSAVGYITNHLAVQMLFKEYFKVGNKSLGGVIVKERKQFEEKISKLVESDVLHHDAVLNAIKNPKFSGAIEELCKHLFQESLPNGVSNDFSCGEVPGINKTIESIKLLISEAFNLSGNNSLLKLLLQSIKLKDILDDNLLKKISHLLSELLQSFSQSPIIIQLLEDLFNNISTQNINYFLGENISHQIKSNIGNTIKDLHTYLKGNHEKDINKIISEAEALINIPDLLSILAENITQKTLASFLGNKNAEHIPHALIQELQTLLENDKSKDILKTLLTKLVEVLENQNLTLFELLSDNLKTHFVDFLSKRLPKIIEEIIPWIQSKKEKLEQVIQDSFNQQVSVLGRVIVNIFIGKIGEFIDPSAKIINILKKQKPEEVSQQACEYLIDFLKKNTVADIVKQNKEQIIHTLTPILHANLKKASKNIDPKIFNNILGQKISSFVPKAQMSNLLNFLLAYVRQSQLKDNFLFSSNLSKLVQNSISKQLDRIFDQELKLLLPSEQRKALAIQAHNKILASIDTNTTKISKALQKNLQTYIGKKSFAEIINLEENTKIQGLIQNGIESFLEKNFNKFKETPLLDYTEILKRNKNISTDLAIYLHSFLVENLHQFFDGKVESLVKNSLERLPPKKLREMMFKALGKEFRPLSLFGGILGSITGGILSILPNASANLVSLGISGTAYGITGWGTNWIAIKMLFRPYNKKYFPIIRKKVPLTPGVIAKNKARFANSMGRFIGERLLNPDSLKQTFSENQDKLSQTFKELISKNDYALIKKIIGDNSDKISKSISHWIIDKLENNDHVLSKLFEGWISGNNFSLKNINLENIKKGILSYIEKDEFKAMLDSILLTELQKYLLKNPEISSVIPNSVKENLNQNIADGISQGIQTLASKLDTNNFLGNINFQGFEMFLQTFLNKNLSELLDEEQSKKLKDKVSNFLTDRLQSEHIQENFFNFISQKLLSTINPDQQIKDIFNGRLLSLLEENLQNILLSVLLEALRYLDDNKQELADKIYIEAVNQAKKQGNFAILGTALYHGSIKKTVLDLIDNGLPNFLEEEFDSLKENIHEQIIRLGEDKIENTELLAINENKLQESIKSILRNQKLIRKIRQITHILFEEKIFKIKLNALTSNEKLNYGNHFQTLLKEEVILVKKHLSEQLEDKEKINAIAQSLSTLLGTVFKQLIFPQKLNVLLDGITEDQIKAVISKVRDSLQKSNAFHKHKDSILDELLQKITEKPLNEIIDTTVLSNNLIQALKTFLEQNKAFISPILNQLIKNFVDKTPESIDIQTKEFITNTSIEAIFGSLKENILSLVESIGFKDIIVDEIKSMHPKELESLFYGFAQKYFKFLIGYGFIFGLIFGLGIDYGLLEIFKLLY